MTPRATPAALAVLAALVGGCGEPERPPPPKAAPVAAPAPAEPTPPAPPPTPTGRAVLVASEFGLSPVACFLDQTREFAAGEACLALAPVGAEVWMMSGAAATVTGRGASECGAAREATLTIDVPRDSLRGEAVLPPALKTALQYTPASAPPDVDRAAPKELRERVARALAAAFPDAGKLAPRIDQTANLDLDDDGAPEQLVAASVPGPDGDDDAPLRVSALLLAGEGGELALLRGRAGARERYHVVGAVDLDGDGRRELYLNTYDPDGFSLSLERQTPEGLRTEGRWSCGG